MIHGLATQRIDLEHEPGEWLEVRTSLSPHAALKAREAKQAASMVAVGAVGAEVGVEGVRVIAEMLAQGRPAADIADAVNSKALPDAVDDKSEPEPEPEPVSVNAPDPARERNKYDLDVAGVSLIASWSYTSPQGSRLPVRLEYVQALDGKTRGLVHRLAWEAISALSDGELEGNF